SKLADGMRQRVDTDAKFADGIGLLVNLAINAAGSQHERGGEPTYTATDDDRLHGQTPNPDATDRLKSHGRLFGRKRLCPLGLELGAGFRLSLNFQVLEILPVAHAVAENLLLAGQILRRAKHLGAVPGGRLHREGGIDQMRAAERNEVGTAC